MNKYFIPMSKDNIEKLISGDKYTTLRSKRQYDSIGLEENETCLVTYNNVNFKVYCHGFHNIGNLDWNVWESEGFTKEDGPKYQQTKDFLEGKISLYIYSFEKLND